ncbi:MAG: BtaA family protein [Planctomycetota bacterium]
MLAHLSRAFFKLCHGNHLVYNTCWEDPRIDRVALELGPGDRLLVITSAGCNALDYALDEPDRIDTVDVNARQNALLDLKLSGIRNLEHDEFFELFGRGKAADWDALYKRLRPGLPAESQAYWDKHGKFFLGSGRRDSFYFRGSAGLFAWLINGYINRWAKNREAIDRLLEAGTIEEQAEIYHKDVKPAFWGPWIKWFLGRDGTLSLLGVPRAQRRQLDRYYPGGIVKFIEDALDTVFAKLPIADNYFWRVYLTGEYTPDCCPNYLKPEPFARLKGGLADRVKTHTSTILDQLTDNEQKYSHFVLLDHMDWMSEHLSDVLATQWQAIVDRADDGARILWRSAALRCEFVDPIKVRVAGRERPLGDLLEYDRDLAEDLHAKDRVHTYCSFSITRLRKTAGDHPAGEHPGGGASRTAATHQADQAKQDDRPEPPKNPVPPDALAHTR